MTDLQEDAFDRDIRELREKQKKEADKKEQQARADAGRGFAKDSGVQGVNPNSMPDMTVDEATRFRNMSEIEKYDYLRALMRIRDNDRLQREPNLIGKIETVCRNADGEIIAYTISFSKEHPYRVNHEGFVTLDKLHILRPAGVELVVGMTGVFVFEAKGGPVIETLFKIDKEQAAS